MRPSLELEGLRRKYGSVTALNDLSFQVPAGQVVGFLGPNGAGKTTTMRAIFGLTDLDAGSVRWNGAPVGQPERRRFGYMPEERGLYPAMLVGEQIEYLGRLHGMSASEAAAGTATWMERLGIADRRDSKVETLSHGNQQRAQLAAALVHDPELLVLDEPLSGLDPTGIDAIGQVLVDRAEDGCCVLFSSHQLDQVEDLCERVTIIDHGRVVASGTVDELTTHGGRRLLVRVEGDRTADWARSVRRCHRVGDRRWRRPPGPRRSRRQRRRPLRCHESRAGHPVLFRAAPALRSVSGGARVKFLYVILIAAAVVSARITIFRYRRRRRLANQAAQRCRRQC